MAIRLYEHNQKAYDSALSMLEKTGKAVIIHPTGTGKSFIGFKLAEEHPDSRVVWLTPSEYIVKTQLDNLKSECGTELENIEFITYPKLMLMTIGEIARLKPDYIVADEYHRMGAKMWSEGVKRLRKIYPNTPMLGLSATNIRYLDNLRNMADELFDGNIASEMTLGEAIVRGILLPPTYVISVYSYAEELKKYGERIDRITNKGIRDKNRRELDKLRRALEMADGLDKVFKRHMTKGKYIVFCSSRAHMDEMLKHTDEWFSAVDGDMHIYKVYSEDPEASQDYAEFKEDNENRLRLLFCIDMLNEGIHVSDIDGVIMFRPTVSPIIYKQQIGRALSANKNKQPIILDVVNNFENLYSISSVEEEIQLAVNYYRDLGEDYNIVNETFSIIDETRDCRHLFANLERSLSSTWEIYFRAAKAYYEEHGDLNVPKRYVTDDGLTLGMWIGTQRRVKSGSINGSLTDAQIRRLDEIGMVWDNVQDLRWKNGYNHAKAYYEANGNLDVKTEYIDDDGFRLGKWVANNRLWYKNNSHSRVLNRERIAMLEAIGMVWDKNDVLWERNFEEAEKYFNVHNDLEVPINYVSENGIKLGAWLHSLRQKRKGSIKSSPLTAEQIARLDSIGMAWEGRQEAQWRSIYNEAKEYYEEHGDLNVPMKYKTKDGITLRKWLYNQKNNKKLSREKTEMLRKIGLFAEPDLRTQKDKSLDEYLNFDISKLNRYSEVRKGNYIGG